MIRLVAFDLDDTLYPERSYVCDGLRKVGRFMKGKLGINGGYRELLKTFNENRRVPTINTALYRLGVPHDERLIQDMLQNYHSLPLRIHPYKDTFTVLGQLVGRYTLALITDGRLETQRNKVEALGLSHLFDEIVYTDALGQEYRKPSEVSFRNVMDRFSLVGQDCAYVGDNSTKDFVAPNRLGWFTVQVKRRGRLYREEESGDYRAQVSVGSLANLPRLLEGR